jgi:Na+/alanine symporter
MTQALHPQTSLYLFVVFGLLLLLLLRRHRCRRFSLSIEIRKHTHTHTESNQNDVRAFLASALTVESRLGADC